MGNVLVLTVHKLQRLLVHLQPSLLKRLHCGPVIGGGSLSDRIPAPAGTQQGLNTQERRAQMEKAERGRSCNRKKEK